MHRDEWTAIAQVIHERWLAVDETDTAEWFEQLQDLDGGLVAQALIGIDERRETPSASSIRRAVNLAVREQAEAAPHPATSPYVSFSEWLRRGAPTYRDDEPDREKVVEEILAVTADDPAFA